jgi:hypothetical protein
MRKSLFAVAFFSMYTVFTTAVWSQEKNEKSLNISCDIVSSFVWRGSLVDLHPNIQPLLSFSKSGFEIGTWGSTNLSADYKEVDLYIQYSIKGFTLGIYDYYWPADWSERNYFIYDNDNTAHIYEGFLKYKAAEKFPITLFASSWLYGDDKFSEIEYPDDSTKWGDQRYSTYFEVLYPFSIGENGLDLFIGGTPTQNAYGNGPGIINIGITGYRSVKITESFELPVKAQLVANPQSEKVYLVIGITL